MDTKEPSLCVLYASQILKETIGGIPTVIIEEKMQGEEFTFQALVGSGEILPLPLVKDFKRLEEGDKGPNTGSMGSFSNGDGLLSFLKSSEKEQALNIMKRTIDFVDEYYAGESYCGFLYGQFMITKDGLRLVEYNVRPGDPEILNVMKIFNGELLPLFKAMLSGGLEETARTVDFSVQPTVCKFIVPEGYPFEPIDPFDMKVDEIE
ncbi:MAG: hypothetical protein AB1420_01495 [Bacillota bacterium]